MTCEERMRLGWKTLEQCHEQYMTSGIVFVVGLLILIPLLIWLTSADR
jgi:hypothetical protein